MSARTENCKWKAGCQNPAYSCLTSCEEYEAFPVDPPESNVENAQRQAELSDVLRCLNSVEARSARRVAPKKTCQDCQHWRGESMWYASPCALSLEPVESVEQYKDYCDKSRLCPFCGEEFSDGSCLRAAAERIAELEQQAGKQATTMQAAAAEVKRLTEGLLHISDTTSDPDLAEWAFRYIGGSAFFGGEGEVK